ncbi:MAG: sensor histidine kinase [Pantoea sp.]|uniref:ATP-binding protein n=1 Tax=Pantoea sp. TaxID=69393 RepID=UPI0039E2C00A
MTFQVKLFLCLAITCCLLTGIIGVIVFYHAYRQSAEDLGIRARVQASEIALLPTLPTLVSNRDTQGIADLLDPLSRKSDADYITIGDLHAIRLYHSFSPQTINQPMIGGDNEGVLAGKTIISVRKGGNGLSLRSKAPIFDEDKHVIGIVSVGYAHAYIDAITWHQLLPVGLSGVVILVVLFALAWLFTRQLKKQMLYMEPIEIASLEKQQKAMLESIFEGVIVTDCQNNIVTINHSARHILELPESEEALIGNQFSHIIQVREPDKVFVDALHAQHDVITQLNAKEVFLNRVPYSAINNEIHGWIFTFRDKNDINILSLKLDQVTRFAENLRVIRHEQQNWTATLAGLLQMKRYEEALAFVHPQSQGAQAMLDFIRQRISLPIVSGLLLGKVDQSKEKGVQLEFDPDCQLTHLPSSLSENALASILGNLIDNAINASVGNISPKEGVLVYINDMNDQLIIEISDKGNGLSSSMRQSLFTPGVSSKQDFWSEQVGLQHGIGLALISDLVNRAYGTIEITENKPKGTVFTVFIPFSIAADSQFNHK